MNWPYLLWYDPLSLQRATTQYTSSSHGMFFPLYNFVLERRLLNKPVYSLRKKLFPSVQWQNKRHDPTLVTAVRPLKKKCMLHGSAKFSIYPSFDRSCFTDILSHIFISPRLGLLGAPETASVIAPRSPLFYALIAKDHLPLKVAAPSLCLPNLPQLPFVLKKKKKIHPLKLGDTNSKNC